MDYDQGIRAGPVGRGLRFLAGIALVFEGSRHLLGPNAALILATSAVVLGEVAFYAVVHLNVLQSVFKLLELIGSNLETLSDE